MINDKGQLAADLPQYHLPELPRLNSLTEFNRAGQADLHRYTQTFPPADSAEEKSVNHIKNHPLSYDCPRV